MENKWQKPVEVGFGIVGYRLVTGPSDAMICLMDHWPAKSGPKFVKALGSCRNAMAGRIAAEIARETFLAAAEEAKLITH